jgi:hypothetical protein
MKRIHVECLPDEALIKQLGFTKKNITHHAGKSRVFKNLQKVNNEVAMVDEDPGTLKTTYEKGLKLIKADEGIKQYTDASDNVIVVLDGKLEDWIVSVCKKYQIDLKHFKLPVKPNDLHDVINHQLINFEKLIQHLIQNNNKAILSLKACLK